MAVPEADCQNCDHHWTLTKQPGEYSRGWPSCPECGSTRVEVEGHERSDVPAAVDSQHAQGQQAAEMQTQEQAAQMQAGGEQVAQTLAPAFDDNASVEERAEGAMRVTQLAGGLLSGFMKYNAAQREAAQQNAKTANIQPVEDKPQCECGFTFSEIPPDVDRIQCESCGREYEVM